jgi:hypothetical protein
MPERSHSGSPSGRQQYAIDEETQDIRDDPGNDAPEDYTTQVDFSHTFSLSVFVEVEDRKKQLR